MSNLHPTTLRRLQKIPQIPSVWEGDRRPLTGIAAELDAEGLEGNGDCIIWVDGSEGVVRAMDVVSPEMGLEAVARALLRAMENPHNPAQPARPQKIVVRDREIHFFLRGTLQSLNIDIDYVPELPLIDELFRGFEQMSQTRPPKLPPQYAKALTQSAFALWNLAPWEFLADHQVMAIELNQWDVETLYVSVMGMLGREYGVLFYRSLESLKQFRSTVLNEQSVERLEKAFLAQDCWFVNFETDDETFDPEEDDLADWDLEDIYPLFGSIHPYEGMRPFLDEEEALAVFVSLKALENFVRSQRQKLAAARYDLPFLHKQCRITLPAAVNGKKTLTLGVSTLPELASELSEMSELTYAADLVETSSLAVEIQDNLVPKDSLVSLGMLPWERVREIRDRNTRHYQSQGIDELGEGLPIIMIQTSRPKAKVMIEQIQEHGGLKAICFNPGEDVLTDTDYDLGLLQTGNNNFYLFGEFISDEPTHLKARKQWNKRSKTTNGYCALAIAMGLKGASRGKPQLRDILALFEAQSLSSQDLGMGMLQLIP